MQMMLSINVWPFFWQQLCCDSPILEGLKITPLDKYISSLNDMPFYFILQMLSYHRLP